MPVDEETYFDACRNTCVLFCGEEDTPDKPECRMFEYSLLLLQQLWFKPVSTKARDSAENTLTYIMNAFERATPREKNDA